MDHQSNSKLGGDCIFCKSFLPLRVCNIRLLDECINFELKIGDKLYRFVALYRSPSQTWDEFLSFSHNFEVNLERFRKQSVVAISYFNARLRHWYSHDTNAFEGISVENVVPQFRLHQMIKEPEHILENSYSSIDLVFTSQTNLIIDWGTHP